MTHRLVGWAKALAGSSTKIRDSRAPCPRCHNSQLRKNAWARRTRDFGLRHSTASAFAHPTRPGPACAETNGKLAASTRRYVSARFGDLRPDRISLRRKLYDGSIIGPRLLCIARLQRRARSTDGGTKAVRLLLQRGLERAERLGCHAAFEQHGAIELARRRERSGRHRRLLGLVLGIGCRAHRLER